MKTSNNTDDIRYPTVKVCGVRDSGSICELRRIGVSYIGVMLYTRSPRYVPMCIAKDLVEEARYNHIDSVAVFVNPEDETIERALSHFTPDFLQLHGDETVERVSYIKDTYQIPIIKGVRIGSYDDVVMIGEYEDIAHIILCDTKIPQGDADTPVYGGSGKVFDSSMLSDRVWKKHWFLAGGLMSSNVSGLIQRCGASGVDVSSGVEIDVGQKSIAMIREFVDSVKSSVERQSGGSDVVS